MADLPKNVPVEDTPPRKILFVGDEKVGKTTFIKNYWKHMCERYGYDRCKGKFLVFTQFVLYRERSGRRVPIWFLDLPAGATEDSRRDQYPAEVNVIVLCFAIDNPTSLANVEQIWLPKLRQYYPGPTRIHLLGLKCEKRMKMFAAGCISVAKETAREVYQRNAFSGDYLECSVQVVPEDARDCMDIFYNDLAH